jgi:hypothetical protein
LSHELIDAFSEVGLALNATLTDMLGEHFSHATERRGCGYTQSTRHLAALVNQPHARGADAAIHLFAARRTPDRAALESALKTVRERVVREESLLALQLMSDLLIPPDTTGALTLAPCADTLKVGTCPLAEKYFLEIAHRTVRRAGQVNVIVSQGTPVLLEKRGLGDDHSCISLTTLVLNRVRLPPGSLFAVDCPNAPTLAPNRELRGSLLSVEHCGFRFLRLSTLAVTPENRQRAFSSHFQAQLDAGLFSPRTITVAQLVQVAQEQLPR